jgi:hypothetical protein
VAGAVDNLTTFNNYTLVGDGELNVRTLKVQITDKKLYDRLAAEGVLEVDGAPATKYDPETDYTIRLDTLPLVPAFEGTINLDGVFEQLAELKVLSSICTAPEGGLRHLHGRAGRGIAAALPSKNLYLNFPTTTEYTDLKQALSEGSVDTRPATRSTSAADHPEPGEIHTPTSSWSILRGHQRRRREARQAEVRGLPGGGRLQAQGAVRPHR